jgi:hypothetical protein
MPEKIELLESRINDLEERLDALESRPKPSEPKSAKELMKAELDGLEKDPESRIKSKMDRGLTRQKAEAAVSERKNFLRIELGLVKAGRKVAGAAALIIGLLLGAFAFNATADQQGFPQQFVSLTNLPPVINASASSNAMTATYGLTNVCTIHRGAGLGFSWLFYTGAGATSNETLFVRSSVDGTNFDQTLSAITRAAQGTNVVCVTTNWNANQLAGLAALEVDAETNGNDVPLTNLGALFNRPNGGP